MVRPRHRAHHTVSARPVLPRDPAGDSPPRIGTTNRRKQRLVSEKLPHLQRHPSNRPATYLARAGFPDVPARQPRRKTQTGPAKSHCLRTLQCSLMAKVELRAGELTAVWVPDETHEAVRD